MAAEQEAGKNGGSTRLRGRPVEELPDGYVTRAEYTKTVGAGVRQVEAWILENRLDVVIFDGKQYLDPTEVPSTEREKLASTQALVKLVGMQSGHIEKNYAAANETHKILSEENKRIREDNTRLAGENRELRTQLDKIVYDHAEHERQRLKAEAEERRLEKAAEMFFMYLPDLIDAAAYRLSPRSTAIQEKTLMLRLEKMPDDKLELLKTSGFLDDQSFAYLVRARSKLRKQREELEETKTKKPEEQKT